MDFLFAHLGEVAALATAMCWVLTSLAFAAAGRRVGSMVVNVTRSIAALVILILVQALVASVWLPNMDTSGLWLLGASGMIGLAVGDQFLFTALVDVGSRISTLLMTIAPPVAAVLAWVLLDEALSWLSIAGIAITLGGIIWVILERPAANVHRPHQRRVRGVIFGAIAGCCQAIGIVLAKIGMGHSRLPAAEHIDPLTAQLVRMAVGAVGITFFAFVVVSTRRFKSRAETFAISPESEHLPPAKRPSVNTAMGMILIGVLFGPVLGVWLSLVSIDLAEAGIATTLMAMTPVFILPFAVWLEREKITWRAGFGAAIAVMGVAVLVMAD